MRQVVHAILVTVFLIAQVQSASAQEDLQKRIFPNLAKAAQEFLTNLGALESFVLIKADEKEGVKIRIYNAVVGGQDLKMMVATDPAGKISGFQLSPG